MNFEEAIENMMQSVALGESFLDGDDFILVDSELGNDATYDYCDDVFSVSSSGDDNSSVRCLSVCSSNLPSIHEKVVYFEDVEEEAASAEKEQQHVLPTQVEFDAKEDMTRELSSPSPTTISSEEAQESSDSSDKETDNEVSAVDQDLKAEGLLNQNALKEGSSVVTRGSNATSITTLNSEEETKQKATESLDSSERDVEEQKTDSSSSIDGSDETKTETSSSSSSPLVADSPKKEISRLSNKKRRKKMKLIKKAAAAAAAAAALTEMTRAGVVHQVAPPEPVPKRRAKSARSIGVRKTSKVANIAVVAATESMAAYRKEVAEQKKRNKKVLRPVPQRLQPIRSSLS